MKWNPFKMHRPMPPSPIRLQFRCNICGRSTEQPDSAFTRDESSCPYCGSCVRHRALMHTLSMELHGACLALGEWPERRDVVGVGLSDWEVYGEKLARKLSYTNTWFHREPRLDICEVPDERVGTCDFVIDSVTESMREPLWGRESSYDDEIIAVLKGSCTASHTKRAGFKVVAFWRLANAYETNWHIAKRRVGGNYKLATLDGESALAG